MNILPTIGAVVLLALIVFGRSYKHHLELFRGDWILFTVKFWPLVGIVLAVASQYLLYSCNNPLLTVVIDGVALYAAYIQICRDC